MDAFRMIEAPSGSSGSAFCTVKRTPFTLSFGGAQNRQRVSISRQAFIAAARVPQQSREKPLSSAEDDDGMDTAQKAGSAHRASQETDLLSDLRPAVSPRQV